MKIEYYSPDMGITSVDCKDGRITRVVLALVIKEDLIETSGHYTAREDVINLLSGSNPLLIYTYLKVGDTWVKGSKVKKIDGEGGPYLRTGADLETADNLGSLPPCEAGWA